MASVAKSPTCSCKPVVERVYTAKEAEEIFKYLDQLPVEYRKKYQRFGKTLIVPRGQASFTAHEGIHYNYKSAGGSPPNYVCSEQLLDIMSRVNKTLGTRFNTILLNKYIGGNDMIRAHSDSTEGWAPGSGFATLAFGEERMFYIHEKTSGARIAYKTSHEPGTVLYMSSDQNSSWMHSVPPSAKHGGTRISLTFREIM